MRVSAGVCGRWSRSPGSEDGSRSLRRPALEGKERGRIASEFRWYRGCVDVRPEPETVQGVFYGTINTYYVKEETQ